MYCRNCGLEVPRSNWFCSRCGQGAPRFQDNSVRSLALGLAIGTKGTAILALPILGVVFAVAGWWAWPTLRRRGAPGLAEPGARATGHGAVFAVGGADGQAMEL